MKVSVLLGRKSDRVETIAPEASVEEAARTLAEKRIGALPVLAPGYRLVGVLSERDISRGLALVGAKVTALTVGELMTRDLAVCRPDDSVRDAMHTMARRHVRHLPVVEDGKLLGILSQRDVLKALLDQTEQEVSVLRDYARAKG